MTVTKGAFRLPCRKTRESPFHSGEADFGCTVLWPGITSKVCHLTFGGPWALSANIIWQTGSVLWERQCGKNSVILKKILPCFNHSPSQIPCPSWIHLQPPCIFHVFFHSLSRDQGFSVNLSSNSLIGSGWVISWRNQKKTLFKGQFKLLSRKGSQPGITPEE